MVRGPGRSGSGCAAATSPPGVNSSPTPRRSSGCSASSPGRTPGPPGSSPSRAAPTVGWNPTRSTPRCGTGSASSAGMSGLGSDGGDVRGSVTGMSEPEFHRDRREHGGASQRLDDDKLAELAEDERVEAGLDDYNPDEVPPATDPLPPGVPEPPPDVRQGNEYQEERAEIRREQEAGELRDPDPFPPTRYDSD